MPSLLLVTQVPALKRSLLQAAFRKCLGKNSPPIAGDQLVDHFRLNHGLHSGKKCHGSEIGLVGQDGPRATGKSRNREYPCGKRTIPTTRLRRQTEAAEFAFIEGNVVIMRHASRDAPILDAVFRDALVTKLINRIINESLQFIVHLLVSPCTRKPYPKRYSTPIVGPGNSHFSTMVSPQAMRHVPHSRQPA